MGDDYKMKAEGSDEVKIRGTKSKKRLIRVFLNNSLLRMGFRTLIAKHLSVNRNYGNSFVIIAQDFFSPLLHIRDSI